MAMRSYQAAWNMFRKVHNTGTPKFHKKRYEEKYQTCGKYSNKKKPVNMWTGSIRFVDNKHINLPKLGIIRVSGDRKSTRLNSSHVSISYAVFCLKKKTNGWGEVVTDQRWEHVR